MYAAMFFTFSSLYGPYYPGYDYVQFVSLHMYIKISSNSTCSMNN